MNRFVRSRASLVVCIDKSPYLAARLWGIKEKKWHKGSGFNNSFLLFYFLQPRSQE